METRFTFGGDEHLLCECAEAMSMDAFFKSLAAVRALREANINGIIEVAGGNASYLVRFDPDVTHPNDMLETVKAIDLQAERSEPILETRIYEIPVYYQDPWTHEGLMRFRERHQDPDGTDLEYAARINGYDTVAAFIKAHHGSPWFVSQVGFVCGVPWLYQMVERERQIEAPKYVRPRTDTPLQTIGHGGAFAAIYAVRGAGGYQMFGITPMPIYQPHPAEPYMGDDLVFCRAGDIVKFRPIECEEYDSILAAIEKHQWSPPIKNVTFDLREFETDIDAYNNNLVEVLYDD